MSVRFANNFKYLRARTVAFHVFIKHTTQLSPGLSRAATSLQHREKLYISSVGKYVPEELYSSAVQPLDRFQS